MRQQAQDPPRSREQQRREPKTRFQQVTLLHLVVLQVGSLFVQPTATLLSLYNGWLLISERDCQNDSADGIQNFNHEPPIHSTRHDFEAM
jgi:hypothetical protein